MTRRELQFMAIVMAVAVGISMSVAIRSIWVMEEAAVVPISCSSGIWL
jgi:hypothetical protein